MNFFLFRRVGCCQKFGKTQSLLFFIDKGPQPAKKKTGAGAVKNRAGSATLLTIHVVTKKSFG